MHVYIYAQWLHMCPFNNGSPKDNGTCHLQPRCPVCRWTKMLDQEDAPFVEQVIKNCICRVLFAPFIYADLFLHVRYILYMFTYYWVFIALYSRYSCYFPIMFYLQLGFGGAYNSQKFLCGPAQPPKDKVPSQFVPFFFAPFGARASLCSPII